MDLRGLPGKTFLVASVGFDGVHCAVQPLRCQPLLGLCLQQDSYSAVFGGNLTYFASFIQRERGAADFVTEPFTG
jgi:hypothetical protein